MNRKIILFLLALLATISVGLFLMFKIAGSTAAHDDTGSAETPSADAGADTPQKETSADAGKDDQAGKPDEPVQPTPPAGGGDTVTTPDDAAGHQGAGDGESTPTPDGADASDEVVIPTPADKPRSKEHGAALNLGEALKMDLWSEALDLLASQGLIKPEAQATLRDWMSRNRYASQEEVGDLRRTDGSKLTRYRFRSEGGQEDALVDVVTTADGRTFIDAVRVVPSADSAQLPPKSDALLTSECFVKALRAGQMSAALKMVEGSEISYATVAGICMIFEEDNYRLRTKLPIRGTFENETNAGYLVYLTTEKSPKPANIGLELVRTEGGWRVKNVSLDTLLSEYENTASAEGCRYFPIVKNPKGGDSLALFFAFNEATLTPRSMRQLQIVADLLKQSQGTLKISGHTDDVGSQAYNLQLSRKRAEAVKAALVSFGVKAEQIDTEGLGKSQPRRMYRAGDSVEEIDYIRGENRRAEIYLDFE